MSGSVGLFRGLVSGFLDNMTKWKRIKQLLATALNLPEKAKKPTPSAALSSHPNPEFQTPGLLPHSAYDLL